MDTGCDLPAAHSMDTRWFAADSEGRVALLDSGETGEVPEDWKGEQDTGDLVVERLIALGYPLRLDRYAAIPSGPEPLHVSGGSPAQWQLGYDLLFRLAHPRVRDLLPEARLLLSPAGCFVFVPVLEARLWQHLLARGLIERVWCGARLASLVGMYHFSCDWGSRGYERTLIPEGHLSLSTLPEPIRALALPLPLRFDEVEAFYPSMMLPCYTRSA